MPAPVTTVPAALHALLAGIIDYAGLFPPARLPLDDALARYARYRQGPDRWMLARFVTPVGRLGDLDAHAELWAETPADDPFRLSLLPRGGDTAETFLDTLRDDLATSRALHERHQRRIVVDALEVRWPSGVLGEDTRTHRAFLDDVGHTLRDAGFGEAEVYLEMPVGTHTPELLPPVLDALAHADGLRAALKIRMGGATPADHPAPERVAPILDACRRAGVRFKATAGLHHPMRHHRESLGGSMNGFLNVFGGAALARAHDLDLDALTRILEERDPAAFRVDQDRFAWRGLSATADEIAETRHTFATSFGSCSFDEPREDLRDLDWL